MDDAKNRRLERLMPYVLLLLLVLSLFFVVKTLGALRSYRFIGSDVRPANTITVMGQGEIFAVPDTANFSVTVTEEAQTPAEAQQKVTIKMNSIIALLKELGIEEKDIKTIDYNLYPKYEYERTGAELYYPVGRQTLVGYSVSQTLSVKVRKSDEAGTVIGRIGELNVSNISSINFVSEDDEALMNQARKLAIEDARAKAKTLSKDLDVRLGRLVEFSDSSGFPYPVTLRDETAYGKGGGEALAVPPELPVGENKIFSQVYLTYEIR